MNKWTTINHGNGGAITFIGSCHDVFDRKMPVILLQDLTIRHDTEKNSWRDEPVLAGPFPDMDSAMVAYLLMRGPV